MAGAVRPGNAAPHRAGVRQRARHVQGGGEEYPTRPCLLYFDRTLSMGDVDAATDAWPRGSSTSAFNRGTVSRSTCRTCRSSCFHARTWKAGGTMVSINPMNKARDSSTAADSEATMLVTHDALYNEVAAGVVGAGVPRCARCSPRTRSITSATTGRVFWRSTKTVPDGTHDLVSSSSRTRDAPSPSRPSPPTTSRS